MADDGCRHHGGRRKVYGGTDGTRQGLWELAAPSAVHQDFLRPMFLPRYLTYLVITMGDFFFLSHSHSEVHKVFRLDDKDDQQFADTQAMLFSSIPGIFCGPASWPRRSGHRTDSLASAQWATGRAWCAGTTT